MNSRSLHDGGMEEPVGRVVKKAFPGFGVYSGIMESYDAEARYFRMPRQDTPSGDMNLPAVAASTGGDHAAPAAATEYACYPRLLLEDVAPPPPPPYHAAATASTSPFSNTMDTVKDVLGKMGKRFGEAARKTENITSNF